MSTDGPADDDAYRRLDAEQRAAADRGEWKTVSRLGVEKARLAPANAEDQYDAALQHALQSRGRLLVELRCTACTRRKNRRVLGTVTMTARGPLAEATHTESSLGFLGRQAKDRGGREQVPYPTSTQYLLLDVTAGRPRDELEVRCHDVFNVAAAALNTAAAASITKRRLIVLPVDEH